MLDRKVLQLNASYEPLTTVDMQRAIVEVWLGEAEVISTYDGEVVRSQHLVMEAPSVIRLLEYRKSKRKRKAYLTRKAVIRRDNFTCCYCGKVKEFKDLTMDHVFPESRGGPKTWENIVTACHGCNQKKANRTPEEVGWKMRFRPYVPQPNTKAFIASGHVHHTWEQWLA